MEKPSKRPEFQQSSRCAGSLKDQLTKILKEEDLSRKLKFLQGFAEETGADMEQMAAALLVLIESQRSSPPPVGQTSRTPYRDARVRPDSKATFQRNEGRPNRPLRPDGGGGGRPARVPMVKYRIEVGRVHGVGPGQIVGAIANNSALSGSDIGGIDIQTHFTTVDLPQTMSDDVIRELRQLEVAGQALRLSKWERGGDGRLREKPSRFNKNKGAKPSWKKSRKRVAPPAANSSVIS